MPDWTPRQGAMLVVGGLLIPDWPRVREPRLAEAQDVLVEPDEVSIRVRDHAFERRGRHVVGRGAQCAVLSDDGGGHRVVVRDGCLAHVGDPPELGGRAGHRAIDTLAGIHGVAGR